jgi:hypothetical protein
MKRKIVSHCYANATYSTPDGYSAPYQQLQVVADDGKLFKLVLYWKDRTDESVAQEWREVEVPPLPETP